MSPHDKEILANILNNQNTLMTIGDGYNDVNMFKKSQISVGIKGIENVTEQADLVVNNIVDISEYFGITQQFEKNNKLLINYTFYRCVMTNISSLTYLLLQIISSGFDKEFIGLFDGFTLVAFNFLWIILPIIVHHTKINSLGIELCKKRKSNYNEIFKWIFFGVLNGLLLILFGNFLLNVINININFSRHLLCFLVILNLNLIYGYMINLIDRVCIIGPLLYIVIACLM